MPNAQSLIPVVAAALAEDIGAGDITSQLLIPASAQADMRFVARQNLVACGTFIPAEVYRQLSSPPPIGGRPGGGQSCSASSMEQESPHPNLPPTGEGIRIEVMTKEGQSVTAGTLLATAHGPARILLTGERVALNLMQRMSGVATLTRAYVDAVRGTKAIILDTRKTMPGLRLLDKYAVRTGGGQNHRMRLDDMVLIKDNHLEIGIRHWGLGISELVARARKELPSLMPNAQCLMPIVVECDTLEQVAEALEARPDRILLDNMNNDMLRRAVAMAAGKVPLEASGNVSLGTVRGIADTGVDYISVGKLTHSAPGVDIGADVTITS